MKESLPKSHVSVPKKSPHEEELPSARRLAYPQEFTPQPMPQRRFFSKRFWPFAGALFIAGLGAGQVAKLYYKQLVQPLKVRAEVMQGPQLAAHIQQSIKDRIYRVKTPLILVIQDPPRSSDANYIEGPLVRWKIESLQFYRAADNSWVDVPRRKNSFYNQYNEHIEHDDRLNFRPLSFGKEREITNSQLKLPYDIVFASQTKWRGSVQAHVEFFTESDNPRRIWQGTTTFDVSGGTNEPIPRPIFKPTPIPTPETRPLILKLQWTRQDKRGWQDVPKKGQKGYPITVTPYESIGFRVVKRFPNLEWPMKPEFLPKWTAQFAGQTPVKYLGDDVFIQWSSVTGPNLHRITSHAGNAITTEIKVVPEPMESGN